VGELGWMKICGPHLWLQAKRKAWFRDALNERNISPNADEN
jgi:hypothetical protein